MSYTTAALCLVLTAVTGILLGIAVGRARRHYAFLRRLSAVESSLGTVTALAVTGALNPSSRSWPLDFGRELPRPTGDDTAYDWLSDRACSSAIHDDALLVNPATSLPMCGALDMGGNPYGCSDSLWESSFSDLSDSGAGSDSWTTSAFSATFD